MGSSGSEWVKIMSRWGSGFESWFSSTHTNRSQVVQGYVTCVNGSRIPCAYACVCVSMCVHVFVCLFECVRVCVWVCVCVLVCVHRCMGALAYMYILTISEWWMQTFSQVRIIPAGINVLILFSLSLNILKCWYLEYFFTWLLHWGKRSLKPNWL